MTLMVSVLCFKFIKHHYTYFLGHKKYKQGWIELKYSQISSLINICYFLSAC